jgi:hypothetical protein
MNQRHKQIIGYVGTSYVGYCICGYLYLRSIGDVNWDTFNPVTVFISYLFSAVSLPLLVTTPVAPVLVFVVIINVITFITVKKMVWPARIVGFLSTTIIYISFWLMMQM